MLLTLSIKNHQGETAHTPEEYNFGHTGGSIGRGNSNDWVLPDQNNFLSKKHAIIEFNEGHFYIIDKSTNGVFINYSATAIGRDNRHQITSSDEILMGEYTLIVRQLDESVNIKGTAPVEPSLPENAKKAKKPRFKVKPHTPDYDDPFSEIFKQAKENDKADAAVEEPAEPIEEKVQEEAVELETIKEPIQKTPKKPKEQREPIASNPVTPNDVSLDKIQNEEADLFSDKKRQQEESNKKTKNTEKETNKPPITQKKTTKEETINADSNPLTHILLSAGLNAEDISKIEPNAETYQLIGQILKESLDGTMNLLRSRNAAKNHLNLDNTLISRHKNNPLKFLPNAQFVLKQTLAPDYIDDSYLPLADALCEAYDDISAHEYSMATSIQEALAITIKKHFEPSSLQRKLEKDSPISSKIPLKREADLWQLFTSIYDEIAEEASECFQALLDQEIVNAYEIQIKHLKEKR